MILFDKKFGYLKSRRIFEASQREIIITTKQNTKIMTHAQKIKTAYEIGFRTANNDDSKPYAQNSEAMQLSEGNKMGDSIKIIKSYNKGLIEGNRAMYSQI